MEVVQINYHTSIAFKMGEESSLGGFHSMHSVLPAMTGINLREPISPFSDFELSAEFLKSKTAYAHILSGIWPLRRSVARPLRHRKSHSTLKRGRNISRASGNVNSNASSMRRNRPRRRSEKRRSLSASRYPESSICKLGSQKEGGSG